MSEHAIAELTLHPACDQVPRMQDDDWTRFVADVKQRGVQEPIVVQRGGIVLDGRHRLRAAHARGDQTIPCRVVELDAHAQLEFIFASAVMRRHLTDDQRSVLAARFQEQLSKIARTQRARKGGKAGGVGRAKPASLSDTASEKLAKRDTRQDAAQQFHVPERKLRSAAEIQRTNPELAGRVLTGDLTLPQAELAACLLLSPGMRHEWLAAEGPNRGNDLTREWTGLPKPVEVKQTRYCDDRRGCLIVRPPRNTPGAMRPEYVDDCIYVLMHGQQGLFTLLGWTDRFYLLRAGQLNPIPVRPGQRECWGMHWQQLRPRHTLLDLLPRSAWRWTG